MSRDLCTAHVFSALIARTNWSQIVRTKIQQEERWPVRAARYASNTRRVAYRDAPSSTVATIHSSEPPGSTPPDTTIRPCFEPPIHHTLPMQRRGASHTLIRYTPSYAIDIKRDWRARGIARVRGSNFEASEVRTDGRMASRHVARSKFGDSLLAGTYKLQRKDFI